MGRGMVMGGGLLGMVCVVAIVGYLMVGGEKEPLRPGETSTSTGGAPRAPTGGGYIEHSVAVLDYAKRQTWELEAKQAIDFYRVENEAYPPSLEGLENIRDLPDGYAWDFDPGTGVARIVDAPR